MKTWQDIDYLLETTQDGSPTLRRRIATRPEFELGQSMHHTGGAWAETQYIYQPVLDKVASWGLPAPRFLSVGLGMGYVELLVARGTVGQPFHLLSFESVPELRDGFVTWIQGGDLPPEILATYQRVGEAASGGDPALLAAMKESLGMALSEGRWRVEGALADDTPAEPVINGIMYDAFSKAVSPELWTMDFVRDFIRKWAGSKVCLSTYSCTGDLKRLLKAEGFQSEIRLGFKAKRHCTFAFKEQ